MTTTIEITNLQITERKEKRENLASVYAGIATVEITGLNGNVEIDVLFKDVSGLDVACTQVYRQIASWGVEVAGVAKNAAGES